jgi:sugar phosphate permease
VQENTVEQMNAVLNRAVSKAGWRLVPVLILMYMLSYLDRANIGFAKQGFQASTGVTEVAFAFGASIFFIGYALFEFPSNLTGYRRAFGMLALLGIAVGLSASGNLPPVWAIFALCFVAMGIICSQPIFWTFPSGYYSGHAAAGSLAVINSIGNLGGFFAPNLKVWAEAGFGPNAGLYAVAAAPFLAMILFFFLKSTNKSESIGATVYQRPQGAAR